MPTAKNINPFENPFGYAVRRHRIRLGLTQEQLGKRVGYSGDAVGKFE
ncbi:MAG: helix-turn-helix domain-containing protein [Nocardioidaceae bacterium]